MAYSITLPKGSLVTVTGDATYTLSEHNRSALSISETEIRQDVRAADGTLRRYWIASKRTYSLAWDMLPALDGQTVDLVGGRNTLYTMYTNNKGLVTFSWKEVNASNVQISKSANVMIDTYTESLQKRFQKFYYNVQITFTEQ